MAQCSASFQANPRRQDISLRKKKQHHNLTYLMQLLSPSWMLVYFKTLLFLTDICQGIFIIFPVSLQGFGISKFSCVDPLDLHIKHLLQVPQHQFSRKPSWPLCLSSWVSPRRSKLKTLRELSSLGCEGEGNNSEGWHFLVVFFLQKDPFLLFPKQSWLYPRQEKSCKYKTINLRKKKKKKKTKQFLLESV